MIKAIIVEEEEPARETLRGLINNHFQTITFVSEAANAPQALLLIKQERPPIRFRDIQSVNVTAYDLQKKLEPTLRDEMELIFITAHESYALQAINFAALEYLFKLITIEDLKEALSKI